MIIEAYNEKNPEFRRQFGNPIGIVIFGFLDPENLVLDSGTTSRGQMIDGQLVYGQPDIWST